MTGLYIAAVVAFAASLFDTLFSARRIEKYGLGVENNPWVRWLVCHLNSPLEGSFVGVMIPSWLLIGVMMAAGWGYLLAGYAGMRVMLNWNQFASMRLEPILDRQLETSRRELASARKDLPTPQGPIEPDGQ